MRLLSTKAPSLHRHYPASSVVRASPPPQTARPVSHELPVDSELPEPPLGFPVLRLLSCVCMLSSLPRQDCWKLFARTLPAASAFPKRETGRLLHCAFRGLLNVYPCYGLHTHRVAITTLSTEGFSDFVTSTAASVVTGWNEPVPGRVYLPLKSTAFHGALPPLRSG